MILLAREGIRHWIPNISIVCESSLRIHDARKVHVLYDVGVCITDVSRAHLVLRIGPDCSWGAASSEIEYLSTMCQLQLTRPGRREARTRVEHKLAGVLQDRAQPPDALQRPRHTLQHR
jgi:hypothetical protein